MLRSDQRAQEYRLPDADHARTALAEAVGQDGFQVLAWIKASEADQWLLNVPAIQTLKQVWEEPYAGPPESLRWRNQDDLPVPTQHICSPSDPEARWANKGSRTWVGVHRFSCTETGDPDQPRLITHGATTPASTADETLVDRIHANLEETGLLPNEHLMDAGFVRVEHVVESPKHYGVTIVGPTARDSSWQAHTPKPLTKASFALIGTGRW